MRDIKFRAKVKYNGNHYFAGEWVFGHYHQNENGEHLIFDNEENYIANIGDFTAYEDVEIDETTLGQDTGLKDKNGVDIYEGDIVEVPTIDEIGNVDLETLIYQKIVYEETMFLCKEVNQTKMASEGGGGASLMCFFVDGLNEIKVIGNIHENPELLDK